MVTMTVYVDVETFCYIVNAENSSLGFKPGTLREVSLKKTRKKPLEIQVPISTLSGFYKKNITHLDIYEIQERNRKIL